MSVHWSQFSPAKRGELSVNLLILLCKPLFIAGVCAWLVKRKDRRLLTFSVILAIFTAFMAFPRLSLKPEPRSQENSAAIAANFNRLWEFAQKGDTGKAPELAATGDADTDAVFKVMRSFFQNLDLVRAKAQRELDALQKLNALDRSVITNKGTLDAEIQKRIASQRIIEQLAGDTLNVLKGARAQLEASSISQEFKRGALQAFDRIPPQFELVYGLQLKHEKAEEEFLQFMKGIFDNYQWTGKKLLFGNDTNAERCKELMQSVNNADAELHAFPKQNLERAQGDLGKVQRLGAQPPATR